MEEDKQEINNDENKQDANNDDNDNDNQEVINDNNETKAGMTEYYNTLPLKVLKEIASENNIMFLGINKQQLIPLIVDKVNENKSIQELNSKLTKWSDLQANTLDLKQEICIFIYLKMREHIDFKTADKDKIMDLFKKSYMPTLNVYYIKANSKYSKDPNSSKKKNVKDYIRKLIIKEIFQTMFKICDSIEIKIEENKKKLENEKQKQIEHGDSDGDSDGESKEPTEPHHQSSNANEEEQEAEFEDDVNDHRQHTKQQKEKMCKENSGNNNNQNQDLFDSISKYSKENNIFESTQLSSKHEKKAYIYLYIAKIINIKNEECFCKCESICGKLKFGYVVSEKETLPPWLKARIRTTCPDVVFKWIRIGDYSGQKYAPIEQIKAKHIGIQCENEIFEKFKEYRIRNKELFRLALNTETLLDYIKEVAERVTYNHNIDICHLQEGQCDGTNEEDGDEEDSDDDNDNDDKSNDKSTTKQQQKKDTFAKFLETEATVESESENENENKSKNGRVIKRRKTKQGNKQRKKKKGEDGEDDCDCDEDDEDDEDEDEDEDDPELIDNENYECYPADYQRWDKIKVPNEQKQDKAEELTEDSIKRILNCIEGQIHLIGGKTSNELKLFKNRLVSVTDFRPRYLSAIPKGIIKYYCDINFELSSSMDLQIGSNILLSHQSTTPLSLFICLYYLCLHGRNNTKFYCDFRDVPNYWKDKTTIVIEKVTFRYNNSKTKIVQFQTNNITIQEIQQKVNDMLFKDYHPDEFFSLRKNKNRSATDVIEAVKLGQPYAFLEKRIFYKKCYFEIFPHDKYNINKYKEQLFNYLNDVAKLFNFTLDERWNFKPLDQKNIENFIKSITTINKRYKGDQEVWRDIFVKSLDYSNVVFIGNWRMLKLGLTLWGCIPIDKDKRISKINNVDVTFADLQRLITEESQINCKVIDVALSIGRILHNNWYYFSCTMIETLESRYPLSTSTSSSSSSPPPPPSSPSPTSLFSNLLNEPTLLSEESKLHLNLQSSSQSSPPTTPTRKSLAELFDEAQTPEEFPTQSSSQSSQSSQSSSPPPQSSPQSVLPLLPLSTLHRSRPDFPPSIPPNTTQIYLPINMNSIHWMLYVINLENNIMYSYDSLGRNFDDVHMKRMLNLIKYCYDKINVEEFKYEIGKCGKQQTNGCGVHLIINSWSDNSGNGVIKYDKKSQDKELREIIYKKMVETVYGNNN